MDILLFFGRFHPVTVHLPIGFLLLAAAMEAASRLPGFRHLRSAVGFALWAGAVTAVGAGTLGYLLSMEGGYAPDAVSWHQWTGIAAAVLAVGAAAVKTLDWKSHTALVRQRIYPACLVLMLAVLMLAGHLGGTLTHGTGYLTRYLPGVLQALGGTSVAPEERKSRIITDVDSAAVFSDVITPLFENRCASCHNPDKKKGDLILTSREAILQGGESGPVLVSGNPEQSELYRRVTLPPTHEDAMPPGERSPLSDDEKLVLGWWIESGADFECLVGALEPPAPVQTAVSRILGLGEQAMNADQMEVAFADTAAILQVQTAGFHVTPLAVESPLLDVNVAASGVTVSVEQLEKLLLCRAQIVRLHLAACGLTDAHVKVIGQLPNLRRLSLQENRISGAGLAELRGLQHLEYLNLVGTAIDDQGLENLHLLQHLSNLYLWRTGVTGDGVRRLQTALPQLTVNTGVDREVLP